MAEEYKEEGNIAYKAGDYDDAIDAYTLAHKSEPRLPIYLLNRSMAYLKLNRWQEAERDCTMVLRKHRVNAKALWRRAKARRSLARLTGNVEKLIEAERGGSLPVVNREKGPEDHRLIPLIRFLVILLHDAVDDSTLFPTTQTSSISLPSFLDLAKGTPSLRHCEPSYAHALNAQSSRPRLRSSAPPHPSTLPSRASTRTTGLPSACTPRPAPAEASR